MTFSVQFGSWLRRSCLYTTLYNQKSMAHRSLWPNTSQSYNTVWHPIFMYCMHANPHCSCSDHRKFMLDIPSMIPVVLEVLEVLQVLEVPEVLEVSKVWVPNHQTIKASWIQALNKCCRPWQGDFMVIGPPGWTSNVYRFSLGNIITSRKHWITFLISFQVHPYLYWWYPHVSCEAWKAPELQLRPLKLILNFPCCTWDCQNT